MSGYEERYSKKVAYKGICIAQEDKFKSIDRIAKTISDIDNDRRKFEH